MILTERQQVAFDHAMRVIGPCLPPSTVEGKGAGEDTVRFALQQLVLELNSQCKTCGAPVDECVRCAAKRFGREQALPKAKELAIKHGPDAIQWLGNALQDMLNPKEDDRGRTRRP